MQGSLIAQSITQKGFIMLKTYIDFYNSPIGIIKIVATDKYLLSIELVKKLAKSTNSNNLAKSCILQLDEYFKGKRKKFDLDLKIEGTEFQKKVWSELLKIPYGSVISYKILAEKIGNPKAFRAVGNANSKNKIPLIIPCHRVISADGSLGGFAWGLNEKSHLLNLEKRP